MEKDAVKHGGINVTKKDYVDAIENGEVSFVNGNFRGDRDLTDAEKKDIETRLMFSLTRRLQREIDKGKSPKSGRIEIKRPASVGAYDY